jgi:hypothetical protein
MNGLCIENPTPQRLGGKALAAVILALALLAGCGKKAWTPTLHPPAEHERASFGADYLKVHMLNGELYVLRSWQFREDRSTFTGGGTLYDVARAPRRTSQRFSIPIDSVALLEANQSRTIQAFGISWLGFWTTVTGLVTGLCVSDPKACFGSCPTFYVYDGERERLAAEGFSSSVARVLEERDVDALHFARPRDGRLELRMTNEALETHAVRHVRLHAVPRTDGVRVFAAPDGGYHAAHVISEPTACRASEGDCREAVRALDATERSSVTDSTDLAAREEILLDFPRQEGPLGLVLSARNTFVTTYVIYQSMAYMGSRAGELLAQLERGDPVLERGAQRLLGALGGIEIAVLEPDGSWRPIGEYYENGPIAADLQIFRFEPPASAEPIRLRLRMAKGSWRIDYAALAGRTTPVEPLVLEPTHIAKRGFHDAEAFDALADPDRYLFTYPGDEYRIVFQLPDDDASYEFFLESQGYYYEWMRGEWLAEEDPAMLTLLLTNPDAALRRLAPAFKKVEPQMESLFWSSKFAWR